MHIRAQRITDNVFVDYAMLQIFFSIYKVQIQMRETRDPRPATQIYQGVGKAFCYLVNNKLIYIMCSAAPCRTGLAEHLYSILLSFKLKLKH